MFYIQVCIAFYLTLLRLRFRVLNINRGCSQSSVLCYTSLWLQLIFTNTQEPVQPLCQPVGLFCRSPRKNLMVLFRFSFIIIGIIILFWTEIQWNSSALAQSSGCICTTNQTFLVLFSKCLKPIQLLFGPDLTAINLAQNIPFSPGWLGWITAERTILWSSWACLTPLSLWSLYQ